MSSGLDVDGTAYYLMVLTARFEVSAPDGPLALVQGLGEFRAADVFFGDPGASSVRYEADTAPAKTKVDVVVNGSAHAPPGRMAAQVRVSLRVADIHKELVVTGDRAPGKAPQPFSKLPVVYERALGGTVTGPSRYSADPRNPVGIGHAGARSADGAVVSGEANVAYANGRHDVAGFGFVSRQWQPRLALAGTYGEAWQVNRWPLLPNDFDPAYFQGAPPDQQSSLIHGGEVVDLENLTPNCHWRFTLPTLQVPVHCHYADRIVGTALRMDTVVIEPDLLRVTLKARVKVPVHRKRPPLLQLVVGHVSSGWLHALAAGKPYRDTRGSQGRVEGTTDYLL